MIVFVNREDFYYDVKTYLKVFYPNDQVTIVNEWQSDVVYAVNIEDNALSVVFYENGTSKYECHANSSQLQGISEMSGSYERRKSQKRLAKWLLHEVANQVTEKKQPWGILTGIRPTKVVFKLMEEYGPDVKKIEAILKEDYKISEEKINLMLQVAHKEQAIINKNKSSEVNLYIGIPFCPSKCIYCSFTSYPISKWEDKLANYIEALNIELKYVSEQLKKDRSIPIRSIYIGGGTPTSLDTKSLEDLLMSINKAYCLDEVEEFTVEAGRPDTITEDKLKLLKHYGVDRISINPQTMNLNTLKLIGRNHTPDDIYKTYELANKIGFKTINMDIIVGLPGEKLEDVKNTLMHIKSMAPNNLTVHTMAYKKGSRLLEEPTKLNPYASEEIEQMIHICEETARDMGLLPYYLYRQKNMVGNFENVGYAKVGHECIYNVEIIEEQANILALGVGGISKIIQNNGTKLERIENLRDVNGYINRIDEMLLRKKKYIDLL